MVSASGKGDGVCEEKYPIVDAGSDANCVVPRHVSEGLLGSHAMAIMGLNLQAGQVC
jgi:hypothetical protein